ncbi:hypothetical protein IJ21_06320 [Paenibacillus sp. 32O-W]|nr:DUF5693 family protein [Paenibacillus sp. 32O-W]ALS26064.1 hypothetical protein IJ21_06320 [Paenibacillus sp. 32O-W]
MLRWQQWNRKAQKWLLALTLIGMIAAVPLGVVRVQMEQTSKEVEFVFNYRNLVQIASYHAHPRAFLNEHLKQMKNAGITTMAVFESTLAELSTAGRLTLYNGTQAATLQGKLPAVGENYTYLLFTGPEEEAAIRPMIEETFARLDIPFGSWSFGGRNGMVIQTPVEDAILKTMPPDPMALKQLKDAGFQILPRLSDRVRPYDPDATERMLAGFAELGVKRILFDGNSVKGYNDNAELKSLEHFGGLLNRYGIGVVSIENMRVPQAGLSRLALLTDYNIVRLYSLSDGDAAAMSPDAIADRFLLAAKDRNIRMFYMNGAPTRSLEQGGVVHPLDNIYKAIGSEEGAVERLASFGFSSGSAGHFDVKTYGWQTPVKGVVALGAIALIALLVGVFVPVLLIPAFILGLLGSAGIYLVLSGSLLEQALALGASISAPTLAMVWAVNRVRNRTDGARRAVGGTDWTIAARSGAFGGKESDAEEGRPVRWMFDGLSAGKRFGLALTIFAVTSLISLAAVPFVVGLLNDVTYSLVLEQFRGVSLLHLAPIALTAVYLFLYTGASVVGSAKRILKMPITVLWVAVAGVLGAVGMYYMSRTGNAGTATSLELFFRNTLESTFGVRPRFKEFLLSHPLFIFGLFVALRYRVAWVLLIVGSIGQLSMVDTFAHIHTPLHISAIRVVLGLGLGAVIGIVIIAAWQVVEGAWKRWGPRNLKW